MSSVQNVFELQADNVLPKLNKKWSGQAAIKEVFVRPYFDKSPYW